MKRVLSIDFDYFIDTDIDTRNNKFPDGVDEKPKSELQKEWDYMYNKYPEIKKIGTIEEFRKCIDLLSSLTKGLVLVSDSHKDIKAFFPLIDPQEDLEVIHIDFHHDNYITGGSRVDCANWLRHLMTQRDDNIAKTDILWVRREDSETTSLMGEFPYPSSTNFFDVQGEFDYIFICFSPEWTPPHLRDEYECLCEAIPHLGTYVI